MWCEVVCQLVNAITTITTYMFLGVLMASNPPSSILCGESGRLCGVR